MAMQVASSEDDDVIAAINTTPLVDVMLVLLIIFLITIPVVTQSVPVNLPRESSQIHVVRPEGINLSISRNGNVYWNEIPLRDNDDLAQRLKTISTTYPQPEIQIRGDEDAPYEYVAKAVLACQRAGIQKLGFVTEPPSSN